MPLRCERCWGCHTRKTPCPPTPRERELLARIETLEAESLRRETLLREAADRYRPDTMPDAPELHPNRYDDPKWEFWRRVHLEVIGDAGRAELARIREE